MDTTDSTLNPKENTYSTPVSEATLTVQNKAKEAQEERNERLKEIYNLFERLPDSDPTKYAKLVTLRQLIGHDISFLERFKFDRSKLLGYLFEALVDLEEDFQPKNHRRSVSNVSGWLFKTALRYGRNEKIAQEIDHSEFANPDSIHISQRGNTISIDGVLEKKLSLAALGIKPRQLRRIDSSLTQLVKQLSSGHFVLKDALDQNRKNRFLEIFEEFKGKRIKVNPGYRLLILPHGLRKIVKECGIIVPKNWRIKYSSFSYKDVVDIANALFPGVVEYPSWAQMKEALDYLMGTHGLFGLCGLGLASKSARKLPTSKDFLTAVERAYKIGPPNFRAVLSEKEDLLFAKYVQKLGKVDLFSDSNSDSNNIFIAQVIAGGVHIFLQRFQYELHQVRNLREVDLDIDIDEIFAELGITDTQAATTANYLTRSE